MAKISVDRRSIVTTRRDLPENKGSQRQTQTLIPLYAEDGRVFCQKKGGCETGEMVAIPMDANGLPLSKGKNK